MSLVISDATSLVTQHLAERLANKASGVPRGLLCFLVLDMLAKKPMSGVEIVEIIDKETGGRWVPSSGSIYPLLAWLNSKGFTNELPTQQTTTSIKRYELTAKGKAFFEKQITVGRKMLDKLEFLVPLLIGKFQFDPNDSKILESTREPARRVVKTLLDLRAEKNFKLTKQFSQEIERILQKCADDLEEIATKVRNASASDHPS